MNVCIAVASCEKYSDAWYPFFKLLDIFWPTYRGYDVHLLTDTRVDISRYGPASGFWSARVFDDVSGGSWCEIVARFAEVCAKRNTLIILFQEDFFLSAPVQPWLIDRAIHLMLSRNSGCVRLYPCPGGTFQGAVPDDHYSLILPGEPYRISCQVALWRPDFLHRIASQCGTTPADFEIRGTELVMQRDPIGPDPIYAFKRDVRPWPVEYLCSAISRGKWNPDAKTLCDAHGIKVDWDARGFEVAQ